MMDARVVIFGLNVGWSMLRIFCEFRDDLVQTLRREVHSSVNFMNACTDGNEVVILIGSFSKVR